MLLEMKNITKCYGELRANHNVNLSLNEGEILAVVGENGAGKTTLMKILYGLEAPTSGEIFLRGKRVNLSSPRHAMAQGIGMVQQHFMLFSEFTVAENIVYGQEPRKGKLFFNQAAATEKVQSLSRQYLLQVDPARRVKDCSVGMQQRIEILKILYQNADIIILDEPTAVLTPQEVDELLKTMKRLVAMGKSIIIITHKLREVMEVSDRVLVMRGGECVDVANTADTSIEELSFKMVGRKMAARSVAESQPGETVLEVDDLHLAGPDGRPILNGFGLHVRAGEIVGIAGVSGNGQSELLQCILGLCAPGSGSIRLRGTEISGWHVGDVRAAGCACIPEDRYRHGCAAEATLTETALMGYQRKEGFSKRGLFKLPKLKEHALRLLKGYDVRCKDPAQKAGELSGGNLQKLIVAREIEEQSPLLLASEPTRGVDIGAMEFIHGTLLDKREKGGAVLLVSSELSEIIQLSDRIYVIYDGAVNGEFTKAEATEEKLGLLMMGGSLDESA